MAKPTTLQDKTVTVLYTSKGDRISLLYNPDNNVILFTAPNTSLQINIVD